MLRVEPRRSVECFKRRGVSGRSYCRLRPPRDRIIVKRRGVAAGQARIFSSASADEPLPRNLLRAS